MSAIEGCPLKREVITLVYYVTDLKIVRNTEVSADEGCPFREVFTYIYIYTRRGISQLTAAHFVGGHILGNESSNRETCARGNLCKK
jgi:hypothetical protein